MWIEGAEYNAESEEIEMVLVMWREETGVRHWGELLGWKWQVAARRAGQGRHGGGVSEKIWQHWALKRKRQWIEIVGSASSTV